MFQSMQSLQQYLDVVYVTLTPIHMQDYISHPAMMDGALQAAFFLLDNNISYLPSAIGRVIRHYTADVITSAVVRIQSKTSHAFDVNVDYLDALGRVAIALRILPI